MQIHFCSFADKRFHKSLKRIKRQAKESCFFTGEIFCWNETFLNEEFKMEMAVFLQPFTFYLCAWKPQIILQVFNKMKEGDVLLYADVGCHLNKKAFKQFNQYIKTVTNSQSGILTTVLDENMAERLWTKGDAFDYFNCRTNPSITETPQLQATTFFIQKRASTVQFLNDWLSVFYHNPTLADRSISLSPNLNGYIEHRSDQSFFSILGKKNNVATFPANEIQGSANWETDMITFPIWAKRDRILDDGFWIHPTPGRLLLLIKRRVKKWKNQH